MMPENMASAKQSTGITTRKSITLMFYPTIPKSAIDNFKFHLKNEIRPVKLFNIHKTMDYHHYTYDLVTQSCSTRLLLFYSTQSFLFCILHITLKLSLPLVFFSSSSLVSTSSAVIFASCFSRQPIVSCGSSRDTMYWCAASA